MAINGIDLIQHDNIAITYKEAKTILYKFLLKICTNSSDPGAPLDTFLATPWAIRLTPVGHGVLGDINHITDKLISVGSWEKFCSYHYIDTSVVLQFLRACGKMPQDIDGSVTGIAKHFFPNISLNDLVPGLAHEAKFDTQMTMKVYEKMVELGKK
jgi:hypothetical protein